jgi:hypothetical protein
MGEGRETRADKNTKCRNKLRGIEGDISVADGIGMICEVKIKV